MTFPKRTQEHIDALYTTDEYGTVFHDLKGNPSQEVVDYFVKNHGIRTDVHRTCISCQIRQIAKYKDSKSKQFPDEKFHPRCDFIPQGLPPGSAEQVRKIATERDIPLDRAQKFLLSTIDPVAWAELMFGFDESSPEWRLRPYQREQLRCTAKRAVFRQGRRSGKTMAMAIKILYLCLTKKISKGRDANGNPVSRGPEVLIITPYSSQISNIFEEMEKLLLRNPDLAREIVTSNKGSLFIKTPFHRMEFRNGANISGFISGIGTKQDGSGGGSMRGDSADIIYLDEMDMISDEVLDKVIRPLLMSSSGVMFYGTSTPIGKRGTFYAYCKERPDFKEFYFPSTILPHWNEVKDEIVADSTQDSFSAEYLAEFQDGTHGAFKPTYIHAARSDYKYDETGTFEFWKRIGVRQSTELVICLGIDWNKNPGSEFFVAGFDPPSGRFIALEATNIKVSQFSAEAYKDEVRRLNYKWKPQYIYADSGYGHTIIEDLKYEAHLLKGKKNKTKYEEETTKIADRLKAFEFAGRIELRDPVTHQQITKPGKIFLVETAIRVFETQRFIFPETDEVLVKQLGNYVKLRESETTGKPIYGPENERIGDHRVDAMMLALGGIYLERSIYSNGQMVGSTPQLFTRDQVGAEAGLDRREDLRDAVASFKREGVGWGPTVLEIMRGSSPGDDRKVREIFQAQEFLKGGGPRKGRGDLGRKVDSPTPPASAFARDEEDVWRKQQVSSHAVERRRTSPRRSRKLK